MVAEHDNLAVAGQVRQVFRNLAHGDVAAAGNGAGGDLEGFAHVEQQGSFAVQQGGGDDVHFKGCFHDGAGKRTGAFWQCR